MLLSRSAYWQNLLNASLPPPLIAARNSDGSWIAQTQSSTNNYVEGNAGQYTWMVPFNPVGPFAQLGGNTAAVSRLNAFFTVLNAGMSLPNFYMGDEPTFEVPWLYNWAGSPSGTQNVVQQIMANAFGTGPNGLPGNDDLGAVSGWYVWGALGLYPGIPGVGGLAIGSPQFASITVHLGNGKTLRIHAPGAPSAKYVQSLSVNGAAHHGSWLDIEALASGATLNFVMGSSPSQWGDERGGRTPFVSGAARAECGRRIQQPRHRQRRQHRYRWSGCGLRRLAVQLLVAGLDGGGRGAGQTVLLQWRELRLVWRPAR
ncbi:putative alpha-1,2-mannosidase [Paraburkholderia sp. Clong3]